MDIKESISYAVMVAKWKVDNEMRQNESRKKHRLTKQKADQRKFQMADLVYALYTQGKIDNEHIKEKCAEIQALGKLANQQEKDLLKVQTEAPPAETKKANLEIGRGIACPNCNTIVPARFCPNCGTDCK